MSGHLFKKQFGVDISCGIGLRWRWYLIAMPIFSLNWILAYQSIYPMYKCGLVQDMGSYTDYVFYCFKGLAPIDLRSIGSRFVFPTIWACIYIAGLICSLGYSGLELDKYTIQIFARVGDRKSWWLSKCLWCVVSTLLYCAIGYCTLAILCAAFRIPISSTNTPDICQMILGSERINYKTLHTGISILLAYILPILVAICLNLLLLTLRLFISPALSFLGCVLVLIVSAYCKSELAIGNYAMIMRSNYVISDGIDPYIGLIILPGLVFLFVMVGIEQIDHMDFLAKAKEGG